MSENVLRRFLADINEFNSSAKKLYFWMIISNLFHIIGQESYFLADKSSLSCYNSIGNSFSGLRIGSKRIELKGSGCLLSLIIIFKNVIFDLERWWF